MGFLIYNYMKVFKYDNFLNERFLTYEDLGLKSPTYSDKVISNVIDIICDENGISEKNFSKLDKVRETVEKVFISNPEIQQKVDECNKNKNRIRYCAEYIYEWFIKGTKIEDI